MRPVWTFSVFSLQSYSCFCERCFFIRWGGANCRSGVGWFYQSLNIPYNGALEKSVEPPLWKSEPPPRKSRPSPKKQLFQGGKTKKKLPKFFLRLRDTYKKYILQKNWVKTAIPALSSGQSNLQTPIWGCHRQLDDQHRSPNTNNKDHLVGQLTI